MEDHHIAAHRVADALRVLAECLPKLSAQASDHVYALVEGAQTATEGGWGETLVAVAECVEETAPFVPLTDAEKRDLFAAVYDEMCDLTSKDHTRTYMDMAEWQLRLEKDQRDEMERDDA